MSSSKLSSISYIFILIILKYSQITLLSNGMSNSSYIPFASLLCYKTYLKWTTAFCNPFWLFTTFCKLTLSSKPSYLWRPYISLKKPSTSYTSDTKYPRPSQASLSLTLLFYALLRPWLSSVSSWGIYAIITYRPTTRLSISPSAALTF